MTILITGFASSENASNASDVVVSSLISDLPASLKIIQSVLHFRIIDANTHNLKSKINELLRAIHPSHCVFVGQAPGRNNVTLESAATNLRFIGPPLEPEGKPQSDVISSTGPATCKATLPNMNTMVQRLLKNGIPAAISHDAGNNLCNQILYEGLQHAEQNSGHPHCGFIHIPALPQQVIERWANYPFMQLEMSREAVAIVLLEVAAAGS